MLHLYQKSLCCYSVARRGERGKFFLLVLGERRKGVGGGGGGARGGIY